jgi:cytochrome c oxidase assembly factor CtaG
VVRYSPPVLVITSRQGPHRKHFSFIVGCVFVAVGTCLPIRCLETVAVYSPYLAVVA